MRRLFGFLVIVILAAPSALALADDPPAVKATVAAMIETTLATAPGQIRQFVLDGDADTFFASAEEATAKDHFTLVFDKPVTLHALAVTTGRKDDSDRLDAGILELSTDGQEFQPLAKFDGGTARAESLDKKEIRAIRLQPDRDLKHPLAIREITIESDPPVAAFKYPIEVFVNVADAPEMQQWADKVARICERAYPMINEELKSDGFKPRSTITLSLKSDYGGVAGTAGGRITGSVKYFKGHPDDVGAMVHETVHVVQQYRRGNRPGWLVEGVADYVRYFKFEPEKKQRPLNPERSHFDGSYRTTAAFLAYLAEKYDREIVLKLNQKMRDAEYNDELFKVYTGKALPELDDEWRQSLRR